MKNYKALLFHPEGDFIRDFERDSKQEVWNEISEMGSKWVFYPIPFVATEKTIVDSPEGLEFLIGKRIKTAQKFFRSTWEKDADGICDAINNGVPLDLIYS